MRVFISSIIFLGLGVFWPVAALAPWMSAEDLRATFSGKTIDGHYPSGREFSESFLAGGEVEYSDDLRASGGHWSVHSGAFCTIYHNDRAGGCYLVRKMSDNCFEFYFIARTEQQASRPGRPAWTAQAWIKGAPSTCVAGAEV